ncbi:hypothetical protein V8F33_001134 [Rhypophila sp. PSN 637]
MLLLNSPLTQRKSPSLIIILTSLRRGLFCLSLTKPNRPHIFRLVPGNPSVDLNMDHKPTRSKSSRMSLDDAWQNSVDRILIAYRGQGLETCFRTRKNTCSYAIFIRFAFRGSNFTEDYAEDSWIMVLCLTVEFQLWIAAWACANIKHTRFT